MFLHHQNIIKDLELNGLEVKCIIALCILSFIIPSVYGASECSASSQWPKVCNCGKGQTEKHYNSKSFLEAREDPSSCCYYEPVKRSRTSDKPIEGITAPRTIIIPPEINALVIEAPKPVEPIVESKEEHTQIIKELERTNRVIAVMDENIEPVKDTKLSKYFVQAFFRYLLPDQYYRSSLLSD